MFLQGNKKVLNTTVFDNITPRVLGRWFMDDGGINGNHSHGIQFNTQSFTISEVQQLCNSINNKYDFNAWVILKKNKPVINLPAKKYETFVNITDIHIENSMKHKLKMR
uniref:LAGLIDADG homing endonuclease n=1 Tax=Malassezia psittaci TaxID=1821823 RepID=UPI0030026BE1|nr:LAGLIDADG homing endonuclease [Malassezia psittaci]